MNKHNILVTGGAGFIGSHLVRHLVGKYPDRTTVNLDKLTYAGNPANLRDIELAGNYVFVRGDICDAALVADTIRRHDIGAIVNLAAETHVDRSIDDPSVFARTNVLGTLTLLQVARDCWGGEAADKRFYQVSTDEVYGSLPLGGGAFSESSPYAPHSPYSASKASADHFVRSFGDTYSLPTLISNCSNNYGSYQFPEKLIPLMVNNIRLDRPLPVYGSGLNVRDWLHVEDHVEAIDLILHNGRPGETYCIGGSNERSNIDLVRLLVRTTDRLLGRSEGTSERLITFVGDRAGHDMRYAIDSSKLRRELGWQPLRTFEEGIEQTVAWYLENIEWLDSVTSGDYMHYYDRMYSGR
ncbi:MAG: dTDP-glucose 4,6-dehydratase [Alistipes sp.]|nr:dTDP-glucose 4,6-dehydratase [Alistipes sp.]